MQGGGSPFDPVGEGKCRVECMHSTNGWSVADFGQSVQQITDGKVSTLRFRKREANFHSVACIVHSTYEDEDPIGRPAQRIRRSL